MPLSQPQPQEEPQPQELLQPQEQPQEVPQPQEEQQPQLVLQQCIEKYPQSIVEDRGSPHRITLCAAGPGCAGKALSGTERRGTITAKRFLYGAFGTTGSRPLGGTAGDATVP